MPSLIDELRALSAVLPPNYRAGGGEVADLLSSAIAYAEHGDKIIEAAHQGPQAVADFFHDHIAAGAADAGHPEPVKGAPVLVASAPAPQAATGQVSQSEFRQLAAKFDELLHALTGDKTSPDPAPPAADSEPAGAAPAGGHAATPDTPAGVPADAGTGV
jgi:hypothetical protein